MQRFLEQGASAWRRTIIVEVSQFAPPVTGAITAASRTTETASAAHAARLRRVLAKRHALPTINRGPALPGEFATSRPLPVLSTLQDGAHLMYVMLYRLYRHGV